MTVEEPHGAVALIVNSQGEYLLHLRDNFPHIAFPGMWSLLGGCRDGDETPEQTIVRELDEEAGLRLADLKHYTTVTSTPSDGESGPVAIFVGHWDGDADALPLSEGVMLRWFAPTMVPRLVMVPWAAQAITQHSTALAHTAAYWDPIYEEGKDWRPVTDAEMAAFASHAEPRPGQCAVDLGCGTGRLARRLHTMGYRVTGVEISAAALAKAREDPSPGPTWLVHDIQTGPPPGIAPGSVDVITLRLVIAFIPDRPALMEQARALLRPEGLLYLVTPVVERVPADRRPIGLTGEEIKDLCRTWDTVGRWEMDWNDCLLLRPGRRQGRP
ncbi:methyltransferase domain-containing protein [Streptomyces sp. cg36]|uniref:methyltransferase domain-containing protein n=1 Tax=Streptomyces sp. cg36 TaxID=3238798 RepID=UPI0034E19EC9